MHPHPHALSPSQHRQPQQRPALRFPLPPLAHFSPSPLAPRITLASHSCHDHAPGERDPLAKQAGKARQERESAITFSLIHNPILVVYVALHPEWICSCNGMQRQREARRKDSRREGQQRKGIELLCAMHALHTHTRTVAGNGYSDADTLVLIHSLHSRSHHRAPPVMRDLKRFECKNCTQSPNARQVQESEPGDRQRVKRDRETSRLLRQEKMEMQPLNGHDWESRRERESPGPQTQLA